MVRFSHNKSVSPTVLSVSVYGLPEVYWTLNGITGKNLLCENTEGLTFGHTVCQLPKTEGRRVVCAKGGSRTYEISTVLRGVSTPC